MRRIIDECGFRFIESVAVEAEAVLAEERGDWTAALAAWTRHRELEPARLDGSREVARVHRMRNRLDEAQRAIDEHLRSVPYSPESNLEAARILALRGDSARARTHIQRAAIVLASADPTYTPAREVRRLAAELGAE